MDFQNRTPHAAHLFRSEFKPDVMYNALVARLRYRLVGGDLSLMDGGADIRFERVEDEHGHALEADEIYGRTGTDLIVLGDAVAPGEPVSSMDVMVEAGPYRQTLRIFGDRVWERVEASGEGKDHKEREESGALAPSAPAPFNTMPLIYAKAFGGAAPTEMGAYPCANNPEGRGFYLFEAQAEGMPLPNIEDPATLVTRWEDQPEPVGLAPYAPLWGLRAARVHEVDEETKRATFHPERGFFDRAHPRLSGQQLKAGEQVRLSGVSTEGTVAFEIPGCPVEVEVILGDQAHVKEPALEEVLVDLRAGHLDPTYRKLFHYLFVPHQLRRTVLRTREE